MDVRNIQNPSFLKSLSVKELEALSHDVRQFLIQTCAVTGGHIGANLGVVELTIALHKHFNSPEDKIIWDVGHQSYIHKILTGRGHQFETLRQYRGLCGFPKLKESDHDVWEAGHSSTSLSAAMGMAKARDILGKKNHIVPVIGDGALTGGMALEALNNIGHDRTNMTIILNDNEMSIAPNVGAMHNMLGRIRMNQGYNRLKFDAESILSRLPGGSRLRESADRIKDSLKYLVVDGAFFEELGIRYIGPVDGHSFEELENALAAADSINKPVLIHVVTKKGKGYHPAENDKIGTWHGLGPYKLETGEQIKGQTQGPSWSQLMSDEILSYAKKDRRVVAITPAMPVGSKLTKFQSELPEQFFDVGIAEQHAVTMAAGLAIEGMKPYVAIYSTFLQRAYDQVLHDVDRQNLNVIFGVDRSGLVGADGETHQGVFDVGFLTQFPNMIVTMPKDENEAKNLVYTAMHHAQGPIAIRYPRGNGLGVEITDKREHLPIGTWEDLTEGQDVALISYGPTLATLVEVAKTLAEQGIRARVINARYIKPMDTTVLGDLGAKNTPVVTVEEAMLNGGLGSQIANYFTDHGYTNRIKRLGIDDTYIEHGDVEQILEDLGLTHDPLVHTIQQFLD
ncbi:TPA: 1-deoxy-D-xylulose-5-phosphate synthase [Staphylococcus pseudintermedius]|uniref:1-deoxy-D-xylulose-5-phosphate synthase n=1 Tax=Staphylococcus pseudintermedius TaxID=283734 RepID=UPI000565B292|nr:1-deoxy-D-xylulose-5-phosphate synthase [Staphylococcus pseudintermedius]ANQ88298.1 1-deoxy-D-xylulose-5-phosphate synthase [Staphylococcus pseudintermedius]AYG56596.1 1-deoxy-D-xylulose-5-phosphate synthase [Staphylococcus pseudintermedius]EGQ0302240.1 1-deoxy-D-xylulose-5-phosphate synthase [Staphylococcus pseudintermedius]EGQ0358664.1 1-deoxy-D-xylulose-5-phosphate synthase [Staphylococcus pseudintermedius]EGQ0363213.1 1-deoxy-D-xylulose-5-phosphate synthase [Staphylococcus pseudintermed